MRCYTVSLRGLDPWIALTGGRLVLGQPGRGRMETTVSIDPHAIVDEASRLIEIPGAGSLIRVPGLYGYRGGVKVHAAPADPMLPAPHADAADLPPLACGILADGLAGAMASGLDALYHLQPGTALQIARFGRIYDTPPRIRVICEADGSCQWHDIVALRRAVAAELAVEDAQEAMPGATEVTLEWMPSPSARRHTDPPTIVAPDGGRHEFRGGDFAAGGAGPDGGWSIPGVLTHVRDRSTRTGGRRSHVERHDVVLAAGVQIIHGTHYRDGVPEGGSLVEDAGASAPIPDDVAEAKAAGNPFAALAGLRSK